MAKSTHLSAVRQALYSSRQKAQTWWQHYCPIEVGLTIRRRPRSKKQRIALTAPTLFFVDDNGQACEMGGETFVLSDPHA